MPERALPSQSERQFQVTVTVERPGMGRMTLEDEAIRVSKWLDSDDAARVAGACVSCTYEPPRLEIDITVDAESLDDLLSRFAGETP